MKRSLLLLPLLVLSGCTSDRKTQLEKVLPPVVTQTARKANPQSPADATECTRVGLTGESAGHYIGLAHFKNGAQAKITVTDDGTSYYLELAPY